MAYLCVDGSAHLSNCLAMDSMECGWDPEVGHYACVEKVPDCAGKQCGGDGCGGQCGTCPQGWPCEVDTCAPTAGGACGYFNEIGKCIEGALWYCNADILFQQVCAETGTTCGFDPQAQKNVCQ